MVCGPKQVGEISQRNGESPFLKERSLQTDPLVELPLHQRLRVKELIWIIWIKQNSNVLRLST